MEKITGAYEEVFVIASSLSLLDAIKSFKKKGIIRKRNIFMHIRESYSRDAVN